MIFPANQTTLNIRPWICCRDDLDILGLFATAFSLFDIFFHVIFSLSDGEIGDRPIRRNVPREVLAVITGN